MLLKYLSLLAICASVVVYAKHPFGGRVIGGQLAKPGQFPFIVSIQETIEEVDFSGHVCGGSILNNQWILTAGHCLLAPDFTYYQVIAGTNLLDTGGILYNVTKVIGHPQFNFSILANDIALIKIDGVFNFTDTVNRIQIGYVSGNESSTALGWGQTEDEETPNELRFVDLTTLSLDDCNTLAEGSAYFDEFRPGPENLCAITSEGKGTCHGDSGGPLVHDNTLIGIVSYLLDENCASKYPDVYTRTWYYREWIRSTIATN